MNRRTFLGLGGGVLGVAVGGAELHRVVSRAGRTRSERESARAPTTTSGPTPPVDTPTETPTDERVSRTFETRPGRLLLGVTPQDGDLGQLGALERWQGSQNAVVGVFVDVDLTTDELLTFGESVLTPIWEHGSIPHVVWQPFVGGRDGTPATVPQDIAAGTHDRLFERWADVLERWLRPGDGPERRLYLNFAPEMNGDWVPWDASAGGTTPDDYVRMYRHVHDVVMAAGLTDTHVQWVWAVNHVGRGSGSFESFYPGDDYVDWCGVHGYNWAKWGGWVTPDGVYDRALAAIRRVSDKPVVVSEYGSSSVLGDGHDSAKKGQWIREAFAYFRDRDVRMALWFNYEKETDWAVFGGSRGTETVRDGSKTYEAYREYREEAAASGVLSAYPDHPRRLTDEEFRGQFASESAR